MADTPAEAFFEQFKVLPDDAERHAHLQSMIDNEESESEWLEFKGVGHVPDLTKGEWLKGEWSKYLSAFGNTGGGIVVWGIKSAKVSGKEFAEKFSFAPDPQGLKGRLDSLRIPAVTPPISGVENLVALAPDENGAGCVVSYIPKSSHPPHRAELAGKNYFVRVGDDTGVAPHELLRNLFFPRIVPGFAFTVETRISGKRSYGISVRVKNIGKATAREPIIVLEVQTNLQMSKTTGEERWHGRYDEGYGKFEGDRPLHPGVATPFLNTHLIVDHDILRGQAHYVQLHFTCFAADSVFPEVVLRFDEHELVGNASKTGTT